MRKIQMTKTAAGPMGTFASGSEYLVEDGLAALWMAAGAGIGKIVIMV